MGGDDGLEVQGRKATLLAVVVEFCMVCVTPSSLARPPPPTLESFLYSVRVVTGG